MYNTTPVFDTVWYSSDKEKREKVLKIQYLMHSDFYHLL